MKNDTSTTLSPHSRLRHTLRSSARPVFLCCLHVSTKTKSMTRSNPTTTSSASTRKARITLAFPYFLFPFKVICAGRTIAEKVACHPNYSCTAAGDPAFPNAFCLYGISVEIINPLHILSGMSTDSKTVNQRFVVYILPYNFQF